MRLTAIAALALAATPVFSFPALRIVTFLPSSDESIVKAPVVSISTTHHSTAAVASSSRPAHRPCNKSNKNIFNQIFKLTGVLPSHVYHNSAENSGLGKGRYRVSIMSIANDNDAITTHSRDQPIAVVHHNGHHHREGWSDNRRHRAADFGPRLAQALSELRPSESYLVSFVFGVGMGALVRIFVLLTILSLRSVFCTSSRRASSSPEDSEGGVALPLEDDEEQLPVYMAEEDEKKPVYEEVTAPAEAEAVVA